MCLKKLKSRGGWFVTEKKKINLKWRLFYSTLGPITGLLEDPALDEKRFGQIKQPV